MKVSDIPDEYISARVLKEPKVVNNSVIKGAIILSQVDYIVQERPRIKELYYVIERRGWRGLNDSVFADIKLVEDLSFLEEAIHKFPDAICLDIGPADFVDTDAFYPIKNVTKAYAGIQISSWDSFKRPELFIRACGLLPNYKFIKIGHYVRKGTIEELSLKNECLLLTKNLNADITYPYSNQSTNSGMLQSKSEINELINKASIGILTSSVEGINRFKMECLSANIPFLVPKDAAYPTQKHINQNTGILYDPTPEGLAKAITYVLSNLDTFNSRDYVLKNTGKDKSLQKLKNALNVLANRREENNSFEDIDWDGRNDSLIWGRKKVFLTIDQIEQSLKLP